MVGVIDVATDQVETPEEVADTIGHSLQYVPRERLIACTNCGMAPMDRAGAEAKLRALVQGAALASRCAALLSQSPASSTFPPRCCSSLVIPASSAAAAPKN
jgi:hypothetical protein